MSNGNINNKNKTNTNRVRAVARVAGSSATPQVVYDIPFSSIIEAWIDCERNKRSSNSCTKFRWNAARDLVELWHEMREGRYKPKASMVFMVTHPVLREVWAGAFRDRVAHHWECSLQLFRSRKQEGLRLLHIGASNRTDRRAIRPYSGLNTRLFLSSTEDKKS